MIDLETYYQQIAARFDYAPLHRPRIIQRVDMAPSIYCPITGTIRVCAGHDAHTQHGSIVHGVARIIEREWYGGDGRGDGWLWRYSAMIVGEVVGLTVEEKQISSRWPWPHWEHQTRPETEGNGERGHSDECRDAVQGKPNATAGILPFLMIGNTR